MFKYQFHKLSKGGKDARSVFLEDILTSDVFGMMYYLPYDDLLRPFLEKIQSKNRRADFSVPSRPPERFTFWKSFPWPDHLPNLARQSIEPDVVIEWDDLVIVVEAKFFSPTDPEELLREYLVGSHEAGENRKFCLLLIDRNLSVPAVYNPDFGRKTSIQKCLLGRSKNLGIAHESSRRDIDASFVWSNWQTVYRIVKKKFSTVAGGGNGNAYPYRRLIEDLLSLMGKKGLQPFEDLGLKDLAACRVDIASMANIGLRVIDPLVALAEKAIDPASIIDLARIP